MLGRLCCCSCCLILHLGEEKQTIKQRNTLKCKTNMEHKITSHVTFTSLSADSEMLAAASSLTRAIVSAAPAAASAAARRACKKSKWPLVHLFETKVIEKKVLLNALFHKKALVTSWAKRPYCMKLHAAASRNGELKTNLTTNVTSLCANFSYRSCSTHVNSNVVP